MSQKLQSYSAPGITVHFDPKLCYHTAICLKSLPEVFDVRRRRWISPEAAPVEKVIETVEKCPSGALTYVLDGQAEQTSGSDEPVSHTNIQVCKNGPLLIQGDFSLQDESGGEITTPGRAALCRCGGTKNPPFCDGSHVAMEFKPDK